MSTPTSPENLQRINAYFEAQSEFFGMLAGRWADEREYEDIADYQKVLQRDAPEGFTITGMVKRPFGFQFTIGTDAVYAIKCTSRTVSWSRVR
jgi:hypothetical protein